MRTNVLIHINGNNLASWLRGFHNILIFIGISLLVDRQFGRLRTGKATAAAGQNAKFTRLQLLRWEDLFVKIISLKSGADKKNFSKNEKTEAFSYKTQRVSWTSKKWAI